MSSEHKLMFYPPPVVRTPERAELEKRMEEAGYGPAKGWDGQFIDDMVEVFRPFLATGKAPDTEPPDKTKSRKSRKSPTESKS